MRLIHVRIRLPGTPGSSESLKAAFHSHTTPEDKVGHLSVHLGDGGELTVGFFISAATLSAAETVAYAVTLRALDSVPALQQAYVTSYSAALVLALFDRMLQEPERRTE
ncbi:hypothetical protein [Streptomyces sp. PTY087I2]|uniref:hypothetical protein n=1 Tax=Streptomyces sp. PTY087I2 TaxID=1819298 RepID=UPI00080B7056|nr:hypothetical protein [Streptomyces sp. PTY087I2]OCC09069.1 hypothetical protein A3Q37_05090 [Streptomyces sp. PTY087I2]